MADDRPRISDKKRRELFLMHGGICHLSGMKIDGTRQRWEVELVMAREDDTGPYSPENVYCATHSRNFRDVPSEKMRRPIKPEMMAMFRRKGAEKGYSIAIETPAGRFANCTEAAAHYGITRQGIRHRIKPGVLGSSYADETTN